MAGTSRDLGQKHPLLFMLILLRRLVLYPRPAGLGLRRAAVELRERSSLLCGILFRFILFLLRAIVLGLALHTQLQPSGIRNKFPSNHPKLCKAHLADREAGRLHAGTDTPS